VAEGAGGLACPGCGARYAAADGIPVLLPPRDPASAPIAAYYDGAATEYEQGHGIGRPGGAWAIRARYLPWLRTRLAGARRVLEVGAGTGLLTRELAALVPEVLASDIAPGMLRYGRERNGLGAAVAADAESLPFRDGAFDAVVAMNALSYCVHKERALAEVHRVLAPGGRLLMIDMNYVLFLPYHLLALKEWRKARLWTRQLLESTPWGWRRRLRAAGFGVEESAAFNWIPHRFGRAAVSALMPLDAVLSRVPLLRRCAMRLAFTGRR